MSETGQSEGLSLLLYQTRYVLRGLHKDHPDCGYAKMATGCEEEAENSGWGDNDRDFPNLKTNGFHKIVSREIIYKSRLPNV